MQRSRYSLILVYSMLKLSMGFQLFEINSSHGKPGQKNALLVTLLFNTSNSYVVSQLFGQNEAKPSP